MANGGDSLIHWVHSAWLAGGTLITGAFMGIVKWNWNRVVKQIDDKADKSEVTQLREDLSARWETQDRMHTENRGRLDQIYQELLKSQRRRP